jgi:hypothetical protein
MNVLLVFVDGFADLSAYSTVRIVNRNGHRLVVGEVASQLIEHIICYLAPQTALELDYATQMHKRIARACLDRQPTVNDLQVVMADDITMVATDEIAQDLLGTGNDVAEVEEEKPRLVVHAKFGDSARSVVAQLVGRTIVNVEHARDSFALITDGR